MIRTESLCKVYNDGHSEEIRAIDELSLTIPKGRLAALTGPSGSGKTTLLSLLGALSRPTSGTIMLDGQSLSAFSDVELARVRRRIGFIFQNFSLIPRLSIWENVTYPLIPRGVVSAERFDIAGRLLDQLGIKGKIEKRPEQLSGGEQQRVAVARALASEPKILLADEPTSNLDSSAAADLSEIIRGVHSTGVTVVISTHDPALLALATDVFELNDGRLECP
jgi:putative ABC transport system ATP-binding protein